ncbi:tRNA rRNA cytosine-C5-methylase [Tubulinosema ratisbonensis]|uniref:tRNA rRNA cytosine-C5-methylase n=1 Tax=Tubulinosema ratisbonensis TaxID=291195 RepID=A0A437AQA1_9MICR|nr:tRNA rRNA cytosine-C5-methylase [Tubulinosema ratisbonensis]
MSQKEHENKKNKHESKKEKSRESNEETLDYQEIEEISEEIQNEEIEFINETVPINAFLLEKLKQIFPKEEHTHFLKESLNPRPMIIRTNTLKIRPSLLNKLLCARGISLEPLYFCSAGFIVYNSPVPLGATPEYLAGYYVIQGGASFLPVLALDVKKDDKVLDMCSSPGLKGCFISTFLSKENFLVVNDICKERLFSLKGNFSRLGIQNVVIINYDARKLELNKFNKILLDAPCSGTGVISKDKSVLTKLNLKELKRISLLQKELILRGYDLLESKGILVYSTCSVLVEENEEVINYLLNKRNDAVILPLSDEESFGKVGRNGFCKFRGKIFHKDMNFAKRIYPHSQNLDGFFVAKIMKK